MHLRSNLALFTASTILAGPLSAALQVDLFGYLGDGLTTVTFSGSATTTGAGVFESSDGNGYFGISKQWNDIGFYTDANGVAYAPEAAPYPQLTINQGTRPIDVIYVDFDGDLPNGAACDFGVGIDDTVDLSFKSGDTVSWSGSAEIAIDINHFYNGSYSSTHYGNSTGLAVLDMTLTVTRAKALWPDAGDWVETWYGWIWPYQRGEGWLWHPVHRTQYAMGTPESMWVWDSQLGWMWTGVGYKDYFYMLQRNMWLYYLEGSEAPRWFYCVTAPADASGMPDYPYATDSELAAP